MLGSVGMLFNCVSSIFKSIERSVNSSEHNFKNDLDTMLEGMGLPEDLRGKIKDYLNEGRDEDLGSKLQDLMGAGIIPPEAAGAVAQLAQQNGVPQSSINQQELMATLDSGEAQQRLGSRFGFEAEESGSEEWRPTQLRPRHWLQA